MTRRLGDKETWRVVEEGRNGETESVSGLPLWLPFKLTGK
jgi:hypothetical protein